MKNSAHVIVLSFVQLLLKSPELAALLVQMCNLRKTNINSVIS